MRRLLRGGSGFLGYGLSLGLLTVVSLMVIPSMIRADGAPAWGAIAVGQSIGAVGSVVIGYGWGISGPARVARADATFRQRELSESVRVRLVLAAPVLVTAAALSAWIAPSSPLLAAAGSVQAASIGLTSNWFFVGLGKPFTMLWAETVPRVLGALAGVVLMEAGGSAMVGLLCMTAGVACAAAVSIAWLLRGLRREGATPSPPRRTREVLFEQRYGLSSNVVSAVYVAVPIAIVSVVSPLVQPTFALVDKVLRQIGSALNAFIAVPQGYVPRAAPEHRAQRARRVILLTAIAATATSGAVFVAGPWLITWLGDGNVAASLLLLALMSANVGLRMFEGVVSRAGLAAFGQVATASRATLLSAAVGFPACAVGAWMWGSEGALAGVLLGLVVRVGIELVVLWRVTGQ